MTPLSVAFLWHMHQPVYRLRGEGSCFMPWVRLHGVRSYYDMVRVLDEFPGVRVTMNLVPSLLEQIHAYGNGASDRFRDTALHPAADLDPQQRVFLLDHFFSAQKEQMIDALPRYADLHARRERARRLRGPAEAWREFTDADYRDLQALFDLSWFGFKAREDYPQIRDLCRRGTAYTESNLREIHDVENAILARLSSLYREAAARGQIEISTTPYAHPILPLLLDTESALEAMPRAPLPPRLRLPEDARAQVEDALDAMEGEFGVRPRGVWPAEGSVSQEAAGLLAECGVSWAASDDQILAGSQRDADADPYRAWRIEAGRRGLAMVFRDHDLSDRIGFVYAGMRAEQAAEGFLAAVLDRARRHDGGRRLALIALDGENPWEHYPRAGGDFLRALYGLLSRTPAVACRTVSEAIEAGGPPGRIHRLRAGSWIRADFSTWIGGPEKNRAWTVLGRVRADVRPLLGDSRRPAETRRAAWEALRAAEGSDWFWWLDGQFSSMYLAQFDQAFRGHLKQAYAALGLATPDFLAWPVASPEHKVSDQVLAEPLAWLEPRIDGFENDFFEWRGAVRLSWVSLSGAGSMQRGSQGVAALWFAFSRAGEFLLRVDPATLDGVPPFASAGVDLSFRVGERVLQLRVDFDREGRLAEARVWRETPADEAAKPQPSTTKAAARKIMELAVPLEEVGLVPGQRAGLLIRLRGAEGELSLREIDLKVPVPGSRHAWSVL